jgi:hypothetical protein
MEVSGHPDAPARLPPGNTLDWRLGCPKSGLEQKNHFSNYETTRTSWLRNTVKRFLIPTAKSDDSYQITFRTTDINKQAHMISPRDDSGQPATLLGWCVLIYPFRTRGRTHVLHRFYERQKTLGPWINNIHRPKTRSEHAGARVKQGLLHDLRFLSFQMITGIVGSRTL